LLTFHRAFRPALFAPFLPGRHQHPIAPFPALALHHFALAPDYASDDAVKCELSRLVVDPFVDHELTMAAGLASDHHRWDRAARRGPAGGMAGLASDTEDLAALPWF
jgi:hypothetical protein